MGTIVPEPGIAAKGGPPSRQRRTESSPDWIA